MAEREKGVASESCPTCDKRLALNEQADGSLAAERCSSCHPIRETRKTETASVDSAPRERGTTVINEEESNHG